jgi:LysR family transcriptional regulator, hydrogen peroxide-inducible genes activator
MNIQQFQYILAVVDLKNFEAAAAACFITQSTLSTMIGKLEAEIGIKIFNRKTKPVSMTQEGMQIVERIRILTNEIHSLKNLVQEMKGEQSGELKIGIIPTLAPYLLPLFLLKLTQAFPKLKVILTEVTSLEIISGLKNRTLDMGILATPLEDENLIELELFFEPLLVYDCSLSKRKQAISVENLNYTNLWLLEDGHCLSTQVKRICELSHKKAEKKINVEFRAASMDSLLKFTKANIGITIIPYLASVELSIEDKKYLIPFTSPTPTRCISLVTHKHFVKKKLVKELQHMIRESVATIIPISKVKKIFKPL